MKSAGPTYKVRLASILAGMIDLRFLCSESRDWNTQQGHVAMLLRAVRVQPHEASQNCAFYSCVSYGVIIDTNPNDEDEDVMDIFVCEYRSTGAHTGINDCISGLGVPVAACLPCFLWLSTGLWHPGLRRYYPVFACWCSVAVSCFAVLFSFYPVRCMVGCRCCLFLSFGSPFCSPPCLGYGNHSGYTFLPRLFYSHVRSYAGSVTSRSGSDQDQAVPCLAGAGPSQYKQHS